MANSIKYNGISTEPLSLKKGNFYIGTGDVQKGPSNFFSTITPPNGGYTIYLDKPTNGPSIYVANNDTELIFITNQIASAGYTTANECLAYYAGQNDKMVFNRNCDEIITNGLVFYLDAGFTTSYPKNGTTWYDIGGSSNGTLTNGPAIYVVQNEAELVSLTNKITGENYTTAAQCLGYFAGQNDKVVFNADYPSVTTNGLVLDLDAGFSPSYPISGTAWNDVSPGANNCSLVNGITYASNGSEFQNSGTLTFDGTNDYVDFFAPNLGTVASVEMWCKIGSGYTGKMFMGWQYYDVWCRDGTIGYNTANGDVYGISQATVASLGIVEQWAHYIFEFRSDVSYTNNKIYINGVSQTLSQQYSNENSGTRNFNSGNGRIGVWRGDLNYCMPMDCAVFRVYNRALTQAEITQNYNAQKGRFQNFYTNGNFQFLTSGGAILNYTSGTANSTTKLPGYNYSLQMPQSQYNTFLSNTAVQVDPTKTYKMTVKNRTLTKGGPGNNILSGGYTGFMTLDSSFRFIDLRNCGGVANTYLTRALNPGDSYAYVSNQNNQWAAPGSDYYFRHFMVYPPSHPEFSKPWEYTRIGFPDPEIYYNEITDIGGGELRLRFSNFSGSTFTTFPDIGYATPVNTPVMNGVAGGTFSYVFYPTEGAFGEWSTYISGNFTGENRNSSTPFRYATKYVHFMHLINYAVPGGTSPLPVMLFGEVKLEEVT